MNCSFTEMYGIVLYILRQHFFERANKFEEGLSSFVDRLTFKNNHVLNPAIKFACPRFWKLAHMIFRWFYQILWNLRIEEFSIYSSDAKKYFSIDMNSAPVKTSLDILNRSFLDGTWSHPVSLRTLFQIVDNYQIE